MPDGLPAGLPPMKCRAGYRLLVNTIELQQEVIDMQGAELDRLEGLIEELRGRIDLLDLVNFPDALLTDDGE